MGSIGNTLVTVPDYIEMWKQNETKAVIEEMKEWREKWLGWNESMSFMDRTAMERNIPQVYLPAVKANYRSNENMESRFNSVAKQLIDAHFEALEDKVTSKIGKIVDIKRVGGRNDYDITGDSGETVRIQVVMAGGYNKQRRHTRWTMNKLGKRG